MCTPSSGESLLEKTGGLHDLAENGEGLGLPSIWDTLAHTVVPALSPYMFRVVRSGSWKALRPSNLLGFRIRCPKLYGLDSTISPP